MSGPSYHGRTHVPGGTDPIPPIGSGNPDWQSYRDAVLSEPSLWGYWPLDDTSGDFQNVVDPTRELTAIETGAYTFTYGQPGPFPAEPAETAVLFNGTDSLPSPTGTQAKLTLTSGEQLLFDALAPFTFEAWAYPTVGDDGWIGGMGDASTGQWSVYLTTAGELEGNRGPVSLDGGGYFPSVNAWVHVAFTFDGTTNRLYANGVVLDSDAGGSVAAKPQFSLGRQTSTGTFVEWFKGRLAHVALYTTALSTATLLVHAGIPAVSVFEPAGYVLTADGAGGTEWAAPTIEVTY